nr:unnamed protein product [Callosobruchus chinensis]
MLPPPIGVAGIRPHKLLSVCPVDFGVYDFVVIGAGATGCVVASRLSEIQDWEILLLEAGDDPDDFVMIPRYFAVNIMTDYNWGHQTVPQQNACLGKVFTEM